MEWAGRAPGLSLRARVPVSSGVPSANANRLFRRNEEMGESMPQIAARGYGLMKNDAVAAASRLIDSTRAVLNAHRSSLWMPRKIGSALSRWMLIFAL